MPGGMRCDAAKLRLSASTALLTLAFQQRFSALDFRRHARGSLVAVTHRCALSGIVFLGLAVCGTVDVITTVVVGDTA
jgi:hypothetical protein